MIKTIEGELKDQSVNHTIDQIVYRLRALTTLDGKKNHRKGTIIETLRGNKILIKNLPEEIIFSELKQTDREAYNRIVETIKIYVKDYR